MSIHIHTINNLYGVFTLGLMVVYTPVKTLAISLGIPENGPFDVWATELKNVGYQHVFFMKSEMSVYELRTFFASALNERDTKPWTFIIMQNYISWYYYTEENTIALLFTDLDDAIFARLVIEN